MGLANARYQTGELKIMDTGDHIEFENERVRVIRVKVSGHEKRPAKNRLDRVLIWLTDSHSHRTADGKKEVSHRKKGDVAFRAASQHEVENASHEPTEMIIVELKK